MNIAALLMRAVATGDYLPYSFEGEWSVAEKEKVESALKPHVPAVVDAGFNNWLIVKSSPSFFMVRRATWDRPECFGAVTDVAQFFTDYYGRRA